MFGLFNKWKIEKHLGSEGGGIYTLTKGGNHFGRFYSRQAAEDVMRRHINEPTAWNYDESGKETSRE